jgi:hypothetical protein
VGDESSNTAFKHGEVGTAMDVLVHDLDVERSEQLAAHVEEAQASFVLLILLVGLLDELRVQQGDDLAAWGADNSGGASDADLGGH